MCKLVHSYQHSSYIWVKFSENCSKGSGDMERTQNWRVWSVVFTLSLHSGVMDSALHNTEKLSQFYAKIICLFGPMFNLHLLLFTAMISQCFGFNKFKKQFWHIAPNDSSISVPCHLHTLALKQVILCNVSAWLMLVHFEGFKRWIDFISYILLWHSKWAAYMNKNIKKKSEWNNTLRQDFS